MGAEVDGRAKLLGRGGLLHWQAMVCEIVPPPPATSPGTTLDSSGEQPWLERRSQDRNQNTHLKCTNQIMAYIS